MLDMPAIRVVSVDAHPLVHAGLRQFISSFNDIQLVGEAYGGIDALGLCERLAPNVVLIDPLLDDGEGVTIVALLKERHPSVHSVALTAAADPWLVERTIRAGAGGYLLNNLSRFDLAQALRAVVAGRVAIAPEITHQLFSGLNHTGGAGAELTEREHAVLDHLVRGHTNAQIAQELNVSRSTVKYYLARMFAKLGVTCRSELVALAYERRLVTPRRRVADEDRPAARLAPSLPYAIKVS